MYKHKLYADKHNLNRKTMKGGSAPVKKDVEILHIGDPQAKSFEMDEPEMVPLTKTRSMRESKKAISTLGLGFKSVKPLKYKY